MRDCAEPMSRRNSEAPMLRRAVKPICKPCQTRMDMTTLISSFVSSLRKS